jgi:hypothetical protein
MILLQLMFFFTFSCLFPVKEKLQPNRIGLLWLFGILLELVFAMFIIFYPSIIYR